MSNQRLMKAKEKAGDGYAKTNAHQCGGGGAERAMRGIGLAIAFGVALVVVFSVVVISVTGACISRRRPVA